MMKIMFQGDSVTDAGRDRSDNHNLAGYSFFVKEKLGNKHEYLNYACSGDTSYHMIVRHGYEFKREMPDVLVCLIGVNDIWRHFGAMNYQAQSKEQLTHHVLQLIEVSRKINPKCKIVLLEPFVLPGQSNLINDGKEMIPEYLAMLKKECKNKVTLYLEMNDFLNKEAKKGNNVTYDGVHPSNEGAKFIGEYLADKLKPLLK